MMKACITFFCVCFAFLAACHGDEKLPEQVAKEFVVAMQQRDYKTAKQLTTSESSSLLDAVAAAKQNLFPVQSGDSCNITVLGVKTDSCFISLQVQHKSYPIKLLLLKRSGSWKVAYDIKSIFQLTE